jgi:predicted acetyltransferase
MTEQLHGLHHAGAEPVAILTASEGGLYGRFGYGRAIDKGKFRVAHGAAFRPDVQVDNVIDVAPEEARPQVRRIYGRVAPTRTGNLVRTDPIWNLRFTDHELFRRGASKRRFGLHPDGYVVYRVRADWADRGPNYALQVDEICAATPVAFASLWRFLLDLDLTREVSYDSGWLDDPLQDLLVDPRGLTLSRHDHIWLRIVDLDRAMGLRSYAAPARLVIEVADAFCPWNHGTWAVELSGDGGSVSPTDASPQIRLDTRDLAACLLGGTPLGRLVTAGRVTGEPEALLSLGAALSTPTAPWCPEGF